MNEGNFVLLDEQRQIIVQRIVGEPSVEETLLFMSQVKSCAVRLRNPRDVRILVDARRLGKGGAKVRKMVTDLLPAEASVLIGLWGAGLMARTIAGLLNIVRKGSMEVRCFGSEEEAGEWLMSARNEGQEGRS